MRVKVDSRVQTLIENGVKSLHRTLIVLVGDKGKEQVANLYHISRQCRGGKKRETVLWCYKKELGFSTHRKKRIKQIKKAKERGTSTDGDTEDPFERFISSTDIRWTYYKHSHKILGNTFSMLVIQDFEALTPNLIARTIETVEGGGLVILLLRTMSSLKQLYTMTMDVHDRYRTSSISDNHSFVGRFNERFILSLTDCTTALVLDDELNVLPICSHNLRINPLPFKKIEESESEKELKELKVSLKDTEPIGSIIQLAKTLDQAKAVLTFVEAISEKTLRSTVSLTAARGRGKSAALGLSIAAAISFGYSNVFVTSPTPENLRTLFEFVFKGLDSIGYKEQIDYSLVESTNPEFNRAIIRVNVFRSHRQTIQYIQPQDYQKISQAELIVIDEAAAIPLPIVRALFGPYLVFLASTINGYEGTGRSLSLKLIHQLRQQNQANTGRILREIDLKEPIRYALSDPVEKWLNSLLCMDASTIAPALLTTGYPPVKDCDLYYVNRDTLFSYHKVSEAMLQRIESLFVTSHYKNSPDDLLLLSDSPSHHLFILLGPVKENEAALPEVLCAVLVSLEGKITKSTVESNIAKKADGDLIPWTISRQFQDNDFPTLSGARIVRIATHPDYQRMGYGLRALELLTLYYQGDILCINEDEMEQQQLDEEKEETPSTLLTEQIKPRKHLPPLFVPLKDRNAERLHYLGVSFGLTASLYYFWKKAGYSPVYIRQTTNELTGEYTCIMLKQLKADDLEIGCAADWLSQYCKDFQKRLISLLSYSFRTIAASLAFSIMNPKILEAPQNNSALNKEDMDRIFSAYDIKRLDAYAHNLIDFHLIMDLLPSLAQLYFLQKLPISLSAGQCTLLIAMALQHKSVDEIAQELNLPVNQVLALFNKMIRRMTKYFRTIQESSLAQKLPDSTNNIQLHKIQPAPQKEGLNNNHEHSEASKQLNNNKKDEALHSKPSIKKKKKKKQKVEQ